MTDNFNLNGKITKFFQIYQSSKPERFALQLFSTIINNLFFSLSDLPDDAVYATEDGELSNSFMNKLISKLCVVNKSGDNNTTNFNNSTNSTDLTDTFNNISMTPAAQQITRKFLLFLDKIQNMNLNDIPNEIINAYTSINDSYPPPELIKSTARFTHMIIIIDKDIKYNDNPTIT